MHKGRAMAEVAGRHCAGALRWLVLLVASAGLVALAGCRSLPSEPIAPAGVELTEQERARYAEAESQVRSPDPAARRQAALALLSMDHPPALQVVLRNMQEADDPAVRVSMIQAAAFYVDHRCFDAVLAAIDDPDPQVRREAALALARFVRPEEVQAVTELVRRQGTTSRQQELLFSALGEGLALTAVPVLIQGLESPDEEPRTAAWEALRKVSLQELPPDPDQWKQWWEINSRRTREGMLEEHLKAVSGELKALSRELNDMEEQHKQLMGLVSSAQSETPKLLLEALASRHGTVRRYASFRLGALSKEELGGLRIDDEGTYDILQRVFAQESAPVRHSIIQFVVQVQGRYRNALITKALSDESPQVLVAAVEALEDGAGAGAVDRLRELLADSPHVEVREAAARVMGSVASEKSIPALMAALEDEAENVRWFAVEGLQELGAVQAVPRISDMLEKDPSARVREIAANTLGELGQPAGVLALRKALADSSERVREKAVSALLALATDNVERMAVIADAFRQHGLLSPARQVLTRVIEQYADAPEMEGRLVETYEQLVEVLKEQLDFVAAAEAYEKLDALMGGSLDVRRELVNCLLQGEQAARIVAAVDGWLAAATEDIEPVIELALEAVEQLAASERTGEASAVLDLAAKALEGETGHRLEARIAQLRRQLGQLEESQASGENAEESGQQPTGSP